MKTKLVSSVVALALAGSMAMAEEGGAFVGVGLGYSSAQFKASGESFSQTYKPSGLNYELIAGYKQFFTQDFGLRYYANFAYADTSAKVDGETYKGKIMDYGVNVDALYNFLSNDTLDFGAFLGLGLGAATYKLTGAGLDPKSKTGLDVALNVGLRSVIAKNHGVEIAARVPFVATKIAEYEGGVKLEGKQNFNVGVRYIFNF